MITHFGSYQRFKIIVFLILLILFPTSLLLGHAKFKITDYKGSKTIQLPDSFIVWHSESVFCDGELLPRNEWYEIDYTTGRFLLKKGLACDSLTFRYRSFPAKLPILKYHREPMKGRVRESKDWKKSREEGEQKASDKFSYSGNIIRGINIGSDNDFSVESGLNLKAKGNITPDMELQAVLNDRSSPIQPEGTSRQLRELDKILIKAISPHFSVEFGDLYLQPTQIKYTSFRKKVKGIKAKTEFENFSAQGALSNIEGKFHSMSFKGKEGNQGPYPLENEKGNQDITIIAGTEKVWLNGEKLTRGEAFDYTIDYNNAEITFTPKHMINSDSRIVVNFEYTTHAYRKMLYMAKTSFETSEIFKLSTSFISQTDDEENSSDLSLSDREREIISAAGDNQDSAVVYSIDTLDQGEADYTYIDTVDNPHYAYAGQDSGKYALSFTHVGHNQGNYSYVGKGVYKYVGPQQGAYRPISYLPLPQKKQLLTTDLQLQLTDYLNIGSEIALSHNDFNKLSDKDDGNNIGEAITLYNSFVQKDIKYLGDLNIRAELEEIDKNFSSLGQFRSSEDYREWNLPSDQKGSERKSSLTLNWSPFGKFEIKGDIGRFNKSNDLLSVKRKVAANLNSFKSYDINVSLKETDDSEKNGLGSGHLYEYSFDVKKRWQHFSPFLSMEREDRNYLLNDSNNYKFKHYRVGSDFNFPNDNSVTLSLGRKNKERIFRGELTDYLTSTFLTSNAELLGLLDLKYKGNFVDYTSLAEAKDEVYHLGEIKSDYSYQDFFNGDFRYKVSNNQTSKVEKIYTKVEDGSGNYTYDEELGEYVPASDGDYIVEYVNTGDYRRVIEMEMENSNNMDFEGLPISTNFEFRTSKTSSAVEGLTPYYINLGKDFTEDTTVQYGKVYVKNSFYFFQREDLSFETFLKWKKLKNQRYYSGKELRYEFIKRLSTSYSFSKKFESNLQLTNKNTYQESPYFYYDSLRVQKNEGELKLFYRGKFGLSSEVTLIGSEKDAGAMGKFWNFSVKGRASRKLLGGNASLSLEYSNITSSKNLRLLPYNLSQGKQVGNNFRWRFSYNRFVGENTIIKVEYRGNKNGQLEVDHHMNTSVRVLF